MLQRALYRSLLRGAAELHGASAGVGLAVTSELQKFACPSPVLRQAAAHHAAPLQAEVRRQFRLHRNYDPASEDTAELIDKGFRALRQCSRRAAQLRDPCWRPKSAAVRYGVGQCIVHGTYGYRGVVVGWDEECGQDAQWQHAMAIHELEHGASQPFYHVLVDVRDREPAQTTYVAQENVHLVASGALDAVHDAMAEGGGEGDAALSPQLAAGENEVENGEEAAAASAADEMPRQRNRVVANPVMHPAVTELMTCFIAAEARYVPNEEIRELYPED